MQLDPERGYDLIGDVHGCTETLTHLLETLGYRKEKGVWCHPWRQAIFLGDIIDRGPHIREALHLVRDMVDHNQAYCIMGNHEYSALGWYTLAPPESGQQFVRDHTPRFTKLLKETLLQFESYPDEWRAFRSWFMELPLYLESDHFRVIHACWDRELMHQLRPVLREGRITLDQLRASAIEDSFIGMALNRVLRGTDMPLPHGLTLVSDEGFVRTVFRTKFWEEAPQTYGDVVFQPNGLPEHAAVTPLNDHQRRRLFLYGPDEPILFIGHYWCSGQPGPLKHNLACLDYSAVKGGKLVAYRLGQERRLNPGHFVWVDVERKEE